MRLTLHPYRFVCLGIMAVVPILIMGAVRMQRAETSQIERSDRETTLAAQALAREAAQIMQAHTNAVRALSRQVEVTGTLDPLALQPVVTAQHSSAQTLGNMW